jgi:microcystin-dependent protein
MPLDLQYELVNLSPADASPVEANFTRAQTYINTELIERSGVVAMTGQLKLIGDPIAALDAVPKNYVDTFVPIGAILMFAGGGPPSGGKWALANGAELESAAYPDLFSVVGTRFVSGPPAAGRFNLPNLVQKFPLGAGTSIPGATGGAADAIVPAHTHPVDHTHPTATSGINSVDHVHQDDHQHSGTTVGANARHNHAIPGTLGTGAGINAQNFSEVRDGDGYVATTSNDQQDHGHDFGTNFKSQQGYGATTGGMNVNHTHLVNVPAFSGNSGAASGAAATVVGANMPPYLVIHFIIRVS